MLKIFPINHPELASKRPPPFRGQGSWWGNEALACFHVTFLSLILRVTCLPENLHDGRLLQIMRVPRPLSRVQLCKSKKQETVTMRSTAKTQLRSDGCK